MSWKIDKETSAITMHRGDTGAYWVQLELDSGNDFQEGDIAIYEVCQGNIVKIHREFPLDDNDGAGNGRFLITFRNSDTDTWVGGTYSTEIRVVLNPKRIGDDVKDGDVVRTIDKAKSTLTIVDVLINI